MTVKNRLHIAEQFLASRELSTISPNCPWQKGLTPPQEYISDMLIQGNYRTDAFSLKLSRFQKPEEAFLCAAMALTAPRSGETHFEDQPDYTEKISRIITDQGGIMAWLTSSVLVMALPRPYPTTTPVVQMASAIKKQIETTLDVTISMGAAPFPWMDFNRREIFHHGIKALDHARFHKPGALIFANAITFNISGDRRYQLGLLEEALTEYHVGVLLDPKDFNLLNSLGVCNSVLNRFDPALEQFEKALEIMPGDVMALYNAGLVCNLMEDLEKGETYLTRASKLDNTLFEVELTAGILFTKAKEFYKALEHLERAGDISPEAGLPHGLIGDICLKQGNYPRGVSAYTKAIKCIPRDPWSLSGLARIYEIQNINMKIALSLALQSIDLEPEIPLFRHRLGRIYLKKGWYEKAAIEFIQAEKYFSSQKGAA